MFERALRAGASPGGHLKAEEKTPASGRAAPWLGRLFSSLEEKSGGIGNDPFCGKWSKVE